MLALGDKAWLNRVAKKLKFSVSESRLDILLSELRILNQDFLTLSAQTRQLEAKRRDVAAPRSSSETKRGVEECRTIKEAFIHLYGALSYACQFCLEEHSANFCLAHITTTESEAPLVRFNMAFTHLSNSSSVQMKPAWITVDSKCRQILQAGTPTSENMDDANISEQALVSLASSLKRKSGPVSGAISTTTHKKKKKGRVTFAMGDNQVAYDLNCPGTGLAYLLTRIPPSLPDYWEQKDFCLQIQKPNPVSDGYIGTFNKSGSYNHLVKYLLPNEERKFSQTTSLAELISSISEAGQSRHLLQYERISLAKQLALAVLQFHATPLLKGSWCSEDVIFFDQGKEIVKQNDAPRTPHFKVLVRKSQSSGKITEDSDELLDETAFIRNPYLFGLGVVMVEIAYQAPLKSLRINKDLFNGCEGRLTDILTVNRLSKTMGAVLGSDYARVVKKCLTCDFGKGDDLSNQGLQDLFHEEVVCELDRLEKGLRALDIRG